MDFELTPEEMMDIMADKGVITHEEKHLMKIVTDYLTYQNVSDVLLWKVNISSWDNFIDKYGD